MITKFAFKNIFRQKRRTIFTITMMVVGFVLSSFSIGWADGSYNNLIDKFTRASTGHMQIHKDDYLKKPTLYKTINNYHEIGKQISELSLVDAWAPRIKSAGLASVDDKTITVQITGIDPSLENNATGFANRVKTGKMIDKDSSYEVLIGKGLARNLEAEINDEIVLLSQAADGSMANDLFKIVGFVDSGEEMADRSSLYMHIRDAEEFFFLNNRTHEIIVITKNLKTIDKAMVQLREALPDTTLNISDWKTVNESFYRSMQADKSGNAILFIIIFIIVAIGVLNTVLMITLERTREFGVLKAMGTRPSSIIQLIVTEISFMAIISIIIGSILSLGILYYFSVKGINMGMSYDISGITFDTFKAEINRNAFLIPSLLIFFSSIIVCIFPAIRASKIEPVKAMRQN